ncbi:FecR domain-containing protein [Acidovorax sp. SDU_ACID1]|uniref:FecR domain-containing protein n=1 Tax=Acidovorax sp. SDU_ACID1 TaxID=3136632 RepID=UPI003873A97F
MSAADAAAPLSRQVALQAAEWFVLLHSDEASASDRQAFEAWYAQDPDHARAWQRALAVSRQAGSVPSALGAPVLGRARHRTGRREAVRALALLMVAAPAGWLAWRHAPQWTATHATATGERSEWRLADGSRIVLDTASAVDIEFDSGQRLLRLRSGAIWVETAPDPQTPARALAVETPQGRVRAIGTRFAVRLEAARSRVAVLQGAVEVAPRAGAAVQRLQAGQQAWFDPWEVSAAEPAPASAGQWARGVLAVDDMRLDDFAAELARYRRGWLHCDPAVAGLRITGAFQLGDTGAVLGNLTHLLPVQVLYRTRYWVTIAPAGAER